MITAARATRALDLTTAAGTVAADAGTATSTPAGGSLGKDAFLKLLVAQMKNQDPMNPMQGDQMATQLATFSSLEQLQQINTTLAGQQSSSNSLLGAIQASSAVNMIGHTVIAAGNQVQVGGTNGSSTVTAFFAGGSASTTLHLYDSGGKEVGTLDLGAAQTGTDTFNINSALKGLPSGVYTYSIDAKNTAGDAVNVQTYMTGRVDGISSGANGVVLNAGGLSIPYANITRVTN